MRHYPDHGHTSWCLGTCPRRTLSPCRRLGRWSGWVWQGASSLPALSLGASFSLPPSSLLLASSSPSGHTRQILRRGASHCGRTDSRGTRRSTAVRESGGAWSATHASAPRSAPCPRLATGGRASAPARRGTPGTSATSAPRYRNPSSPLDLLSAWETLQVDRPDVFSRRAKTEHTELSFHHQHAENCIKC